MDDSLCLCFPCILSYLGGYVFPKQEFQFYPQLQRRGFSAAQQKAIAEEWYWIAIERETNVKDYLRGYVTFRDGHWWRPPPLLVPPPRKVDAPRPTTRGSSATQVSSSPGPGPST